MQAQLLKSIDKCFCSLSSSLVSVSDVSIESTHHLRLNIKKIRVFLKVIDYKQNVRPDSKTIKSINNIFTYSGLLRDTQVHIQILKTLNDQSDNEIEDLIALFKSDQKRWEKILKNSLKRLNPFNIVLLNQRIDNYIENQNDKTLKGFLEQKAREYQIEFLHLVSQVIEEDNLHRIRILLKEYINLLSIIKKDILAQIDISNLENLDNLQRKLGEWHDLKLLYDKILTLNPNTQNVLEIIKVKKDNLYSITIDALNVLKNKKGQSPFLI